MKYSQEFIDNNERMKKLSKLLEDVNYQMLGETAETKSLYEGLYQNILDELKRLTEEQKRIAKENQNV